MAASDTLRAYTPSSPPTLEGNDRRYLIEELNKLSKALNATVAVVRVLEARIAALEP